METHGKTMRFSPAFAEITTRFGPITAAVYGVVWRYCQMYEHCCYASHATLARESGYSISTVQRRLALLAREGYLRDMNAGKKGAAHILVVTHQLEIDTLAASNGKAQPAPAAPVEAGSPDRSPRPVSPAPAPDRSAGPVSTPETPAQIGHGSVPQTQPLRSGRPTNKTLLKDIGKDQESQKGTESTADRLWQGIVPLIAKEIPIDAVREALDAVIPLNWNGGELFLGYDRRAAREILTDRLGPLIRQRLKKLYPRLEPTVSFCHVTPGNTPRARPDPS